MNLHAPRTPDATPVLSRAFPQIPMAPGLSLEAEWCAQNAVAVSYDGAAIVTATLMPGEPETLHIKASTDAPGDHQTAAVLIALEQVFAARETCRDLHLVLEGLPDVSPRSLPFVYRDGAKLAVSRSGFYQCPLLWQGHEQAGRTRATPVPGPEGREHPLRPPHPEGLVYRRFDPVAGLTVSFRTVDIERDLDMFHRWMNDGRVAFFWELAKPRADLRDYLEELHEKPHTYPLIGSFDGQDAGYFETYWVREDRLGPYYESGPWDRGWHGLIGERRHLGRVKTGAWLRALTHHLFLDCPMTENIMGEPRVDNAKLLSYADGLAYEKVKEFDFPHKRSALMRCRRERFFEEVRL